MADRINNNDLLFYKASYIAKHLGLKRIRSCIKSYEIDEKQFFKVSTNGGMQNILYLSCKGVQRLLINTRKSIPHELLLEFNIEKLKAPCREILFIENIKFAFADVNFKSGFYIHPYYIDLYSEEYKLAIEFDEYHHTCTTNRESDIIRQKYIETSLNCVFMRHLHGDDIFNFIYKIRLFLHDKSPK